VRDDDEEAEEAGEEGSWALSGTCTLTWSFSCGFEVELGLEADVAEV